MIKDLIKKLLGKAGFVLKRKVVGFDHLQAITLMLQRKPDPVIFDVGAHIGETALSFSRVKPNAQIYRFEPFQKSYEALKNNVSGYRNVNCFNLGLSDTAGARVFNINEGSQTNSLLELDKRAAKTWLNNTGLRPEGKVECEFDTLDGFISRHEIEEIDLLKIDVQGAEYKVLEGSRSALASGRVRAIYFEIILGPTYEGQWSMGQYLSYLESNGFRLVGIFNLTYGERQELIQIDASCVCEA